MICCRGWEIRVFKIIIYLQFFSIKFIIIQSINRCWLAFQFRSLVVIFIQFSLSKWRDLFGANIRPSSLFTIVNHLHAFVFYKHIQGQMLISILYLVNIAKWQYEASSFKMFSSDEDIKRLKFVIVGLEFRQEGKYLALSSLKKLHFNRKGNSSSIS